MKPVIIDIGSYALKLGFGGEFAPRLDIPLLSGKVREELGFMDRRRIFKDLNLTKMTQEYFFGAEAMFLRNFLDLNWISDGKAITDEFFFKKLFENALDSLKIKVSSQPILISQPFYTDMVGYLGKILFSSYNAYEIIPTFQPLLNYLAGGFRTGMVVDIGHQITQITPMINGVIITDGVRVVDTGGKVITDVMLDLMVEKNTFAGLNDSVILSPWAIADTVKELYCYISRSPKDELDQSKQKATEITFPLLAGESIQIGVERFLAPEMLFMSQEGGVQPIDEVVYEIVSKYDPPYQQALLGNILLTGGTALLPGLAERLRDELLRRFADSEYNINIHAFAQFGNPRHSTFFGAAKFAALETIDASLKISRMDYEYKGTIQIPADFMEQFPSIFEKSADIKLQPIIVSVKNFHNSTLLQRIYNAVNSQAVISLTALSAALKRSPAELYEAVDAMLSYNIIEGEFEGYKFINTQFKEEPEEGIPVQPAAPVGEPAVSQPQAKEEPYVPSFQKFSGIGQEQAQPGRAKQQVGGEEYVPSFQQFGGIGQEDVEPRRARQQVGGEEYVPSFQQFGGIGQEDVESRRARQQVDDQEYVPSFQRLDQQMPDQLKPQRIRSHPEEQEYVPTYEQLDEQIPDQAPPRRARPGPGSEEYVPSFQQLDEVMPNQLEIKKPVHHGVQEEPEAVQGTEHEYTFQKIDEQLKEQWEADETVVTGEVKSAREQLKAMLGTGPSYARAEEEKRKEWEESGLVSTPQAVKPKGFFDEVALPAETGGESATFAKVEEEKAAEWEADEKVVTGKVESARDKLKAMLTSGPSYAQAEEEKKKEWDESGLISVPKRGAPKGFFKQPVVQQEDNVPTFLKIKDQEVPQPKKVMIADLLQPKAVAARPAMPKKSGVPTFLEGSDLSEEQLHQLKLFEEEEKKKKEKEEKLL